MPTLREYTHRRIVETNTTYNPITDRMETIEIHEEPHREGVALAVREEEQTHGHQENTSDNTSFIQRGMNDVYETLQETMLRDIRDRHIINQLKKYFSEEELNDIALGKFFGGKGLRDLLEKSIKISI